MARFPRVNIQGALYYTTARGDNDARIFKESKDYDMYLWLLKKYKSQYGFKLFSYILMPTHVHLLIELREGATISEIMHDLNSNYIKYFNAKYERHGHLFQERYKMAIVEKGPYLLGLGAYIHLNPVVAGLVRDAKEYGYTSLISYLRTEEPKNQGTEELKNQGTEELKNRRTEEQLNLEEEIKEVNGCLEGKSYADFLTQVKKEEMDGLGRELNKKPILGSAEFVEMVKAEIEKNRQLKTEGAKMRNETHRRFVLAGGAIVLVLGVVATYLYARTIWLNETAKKELKARETELSTRMIKEKAKIYQDLDEKYRADQVSYQAMSERMEIEKERVKKLEEQLKTKKPKN